MEGESERGRLRKCERARPRERVCDIEKVSTRERERVSGRASVRERDNDRERGREGVRERKERDIEGVRE